MSAFGLVTHSSLRALGEERWRGLLPPDPPPFLRFELLDALERTGCVRPDKGWAPLHLELRHGARSVALAPAYVKGNSEGEFVFDHSWARFAQARLRLDYYPKLIVAAPFTPATGPRLLIAPGEDRTSVTCAFAAGLEAVCSELGLSGAHVLFSSPEQTDEFVDAGLVRRVGVQFHWQNAGYSSFEDFLQRFDSKRRNQIRRERRRVREQGITLSVHSGRELSPELVDAMYRFYVSTVEKFYWGKQYLNRAFFEEICSTMGDGVHVVLARDESGKPVGGAFNLIGGGALYGRYWGADRDVECLHFEACFYAGIEDAIARGLCVFEPGAGGEHKLARGFEPTLTFSAHHLADPRLDAAVRQACKEEGVAVADEVARARAEGVLKPIAR